MCVWRLYVQTCKPSQNSSQQALGVPIDWESLYLDMNALQSEILGLDSDKNKLLSTFESQNSLLKVRAGLTDAAATYTLFSLVAQCRSAHHRNAMLYRNSGNIFCHIVFPLG